MMIVVASTNGRVGIREAVEVLKSGGSAIDAVETGIRLVEANPDDHTVGYSGYPNLLGEVELDASIMDGRTLSSGAVAAMKGYPHAISVARQVMERLPHVLLAGEGAARFAAEMGHSPQNLLTPAAQERWAARLQQRISEDALQQLNGEKELSKWVDLATDPERTQGTVNFIARDAQGNICAGVSTSGWAWKYPGRVGDSPVIGAGNYADNRYGAAACTGMGEMAIRASTAHTIIFYLKMGLSIQEAGQRAMVDLNDLGGRYLSVMNVVVMDKEGNHTGFTSVPERTYIYQTAAMADPVEVERILIPIKTRWGQDGEGL